MSPNNKSSLFRLPNPEDFYSCTEDIKEQIVELYRRAFGSGSMALEINWAAKVFSNNVINKSTHISGKVVPVAVQAFAQNMTSGENDSELFANILGWIVEMVNSWFDMADEVINQTKVSRSSLTLSSNQETPWYKNPGVGMTAVNDCFMLQAMAYNTVYWFVGKKYPNLADDLSDAMRDTYRARYSGVAFEEGLKKIKNLSESYTMENYKELVRYKYSVPYFVAPLRYAAMIKGKHHDAQFMKQVTELMIEIGYLAKLRIEWEEIFSKSESQISPMSWFSVSAVEMLHSEENLEKIEELRVALIGQDKPLLQNIFYKMHLDKKFKEENEILYKKIIQLAEALRFEINPDFFLDVLKSYIQ